MDNKLQNACVTPKDLTFQLLEDITNHFSEEHKVGCGGYGAVYKGIHNGEEIAVKKLHQLPGLNDDQFRNELNNLMRAQHQNIVRLVGYCYEIRHKLVEHNGLYILARLEERILCFEYICEVEALTNEFCGLDWQTRYKIIKGICEGLYYLHKGSKDRIYHLDLKPANILLDDSTMPKIGDFGLSRLFASTKSHTTKKNIGTVPYMPPEYVTMGQISKQYDVFSLGVTIIQIISGPEGYSKRADMPSQEFIELVQKNWRERIEGTKFAEEYYPQVKRCIEIALNCVEHDKHKRPTIEDVIHQLKETETMIHETVEGENGQIIDKPGDLQTLIHEESISHELAIVNTNSKREEMAHGGKQGSNQMHIIEGKGEQDKEKAGHAKSGPWGGNAGWAHNIQVLPERLESVTIWSADIIDAFAFSYNDLKNKKHIIGPWRGPGGSAYTIQLGPSEFLKEVSGTTGPYICAVADVVKSITFITNENSYGPFGDGGGTPFHTTAQGGGSIVGFFGRAGSFVHSIIGVYVNPDRHAIGKQISADGKEETSELDIIEGERRTEDDDIRLGPFEHLTGMSGTVGSFGTLRNAITSLKFATSQGSSYGPFGQGGGTEFKVPVERNGGIVGFFGSSGSYLEALGVYIRRYWL